jgi:ferredoxin
MNRADLARFPAAKALLRSRWPQFLVTATALGGFVLAIVAGLAGTPVGSRNFSVVMVWIAWWALLILITVPLLGRGWCSICPIPAPGEWLQRGAVLGRAGSYRGLGRRWPKALRNIWLQNAAFLILALFAVVVLTQPLITAVLLLSLIITSVVTSLVFERRAFCRYLCPVGGFIGLYSQLAPVELRVKDTAVCASHKVKTCYTGDESGYGCPWLVFPAGLVKNINCGLCFECVRTCPYDNIAFNLRAFGADLLRPGGRRLDEAFKAFIMLGSALIYIAVMLGPWGALKSTAYSVGSPAWFVYALAFLGFVLVLLPGTFFLAVLLARSLLSSKLPARKAFIHFAYALTPLGLAAWVAFSLSFVFANLSYVWPVLSDPMGWGWNLMGTAGLAWTPYLGAAVPVLQVGVLLVGLVWTSLTAGQIAGQIAGGDQAASPSIRQVWPIAAFCLILTLGLLALLVG